MSKDFVIEAIRRLKLFLLVISVIMSIGIVKYKTQGIEYFSIVIHALGIMAIVLSYIDILNIYEKIEKYQNQLLICGGIYLESVMIASLFLSYCFKTRLWLS